MKEEKNPAPGGKLRALAETATLAGGNLLVLLLNAER